MKLEEFKDKLQDYGFWYGDEMMLEVQTELLNAYESQQDEIECLKHNIKVYQEREQIGIRRLEKVVRYLQIQELTDEQINHILRLEEENF